MKPTGGAATGKLYGSLDSSRRSTQGSVSDFSDSSTKHTTPSRQKQQKSGTRSFSNIFLSCFSPPVSEAAKAGVNSDEYKSITDSSASSRGKRQGSSRGVYATSHKPMQRESGSVKFTIEEIYNATSDFSPASKIGHGGFGIVYKGKLDDGTLVAVKRSRKGKGAVQEMLLNVEFQTEIRMLERVEHMNLVRFFGYLENEDERIVVVEYVANGTLREHLDCIHGTVLDLAARLDIAIDVAHGITYLHMYADHPIIHRDIKSSNILLTKKLRAKVADFGFARLAPDVDSGNTHVTTNVKGTAGYLDPEYLRTFRLSEKSDVFSFGVLLVELVSGRRPIEPKRELDERVTTRWVMRMCEGGEAMSIWDPRLEQSAGSGKTIERILELAFECLAPSRHNRPTMRRCAEILWTIRKDYRDSLASDTSSISPNSYKSSSTKTNINI